jgi:hypothetical protein
MTLSSVMIGRLNRENFIDLLEVTTPRYLATLPPPTDGLAFIRRGQV